MGIGASQPGHVCRCLAEGTRSSPKAGTVPAARFRGWSGSPHGTTIDFGRPAGRLAGLGEGRGFDRPGVGSSRMRTVETILLVEVLAVGLSAVFLVPIVLILWATPLARTPAAATLFRAAAWGGTLITLGAVIDRTLS